MRTRRFRRRAALLSAAALLVFGHTVPVGAVGEIRTVETESLKIVFDSEWGARTSPGYLPIRFDITNLGDARIIEIVGQGTRFIRGPRMRPSSVIVRQTLRLSRGDRVRLTVPIPIYGDNENMRFEIREGGRTLERFNYASVQSRSLPDDAAALIVADSGTPFGRAAATWPRKVSTTSSGTVLTRTPSGTVTSSTLPPTAGVPTRPLDFLLHPARLPANWLGFTSLRAVIVGSGEWKQLDDGQRNALLTWTACGGDLIFVDGDATALLPAGQRPPAASADGPAGAYFFGRLHLLSSAAIERDGLATVLSRAATLQDPNWALPANRARDWSAIAARGFRLPIPDVEGVPARAYLAILIVFAILIGPVNYWVLRRKRQLVLLVLTAPIISAIFILLLGGYVIAGEGVGVRGRVMSFTMLDQARKQAVTRASASLYAAGLAPSGGLRFPRELAVYPIGTDGNGARDTQELDLSESQHFVSGGIEARAPANLEIIGFRAARERLSFSRDAADMRVVNGLGSTVLELIYREGNTLYRATDPLTAGAQGILKRTTPGAADAVPRGLPLTARFEHLIEHLPEGSYVAVLERSPFWEAGVKRVEERGSVHVVFGWVAGQP